MNNKNKFIFAILYSLFVSLIKNFFILIPFLIIALFLFKKNFIKSLLHLNIINLIVIITLAFTWSSIKNGILTGFLIALRVNMIYIIFSALIFPMGFGGVYEVLLFLKVPEKLRILIILTLRGIYILKERFDAALISLMLRAPGLKKFSKLKAFTYITGSVLLQASEHSEKMEYAIKCRGGFNGFNAVVL